MAYPQSTLPNKQDDELNPGNKTQDLFDAEKRAAYVSSGTDTNNSTGALKEAEEDPNLPVKDGFYRPTGGSSKPKKVTLKGVMKKRGPIFAIVSLVFGAGLGFSALFSPSLLLIHMKEIMFDKFNTSIASMDARSSRLIAAKNNQATSGLCSNVVSIKCRFSTMSERQVADFKSAGITVLPETPTNGTRTKPTGYVFKDQTITATDFSRLSQSDPDFRNALRKAYNPRFGSLWGRGWDATARILGINKQPTDVSGANDDERFRKLNAIATTGDPDGDLRSRADFETDDCPAECAQDKADEANRKAAEINSDGESRDAARRAQAVLSGAPLETVGNAVKITGAYDSYCQAYSTIRAIGFAGKTIRAIQLSRYAMAFFKVADEVKATGNVSPETMAFMGGILTEVTYDVGSTTRDIVRGSATDSFGYKYAAFGDTSGPTKSMNIASRYIAGGGFAGQLQEFSDQLLLTFPGGAATAKETCGFLANPLVQGGSIVLGIASLIVPGANAIKISTGIATSALISFGMAMLPTLLADIVAGTVTEGINGEESGNAITSGAGKILSDTLAGQNGGALMSKTDALAYTRVQNQTIARYAEEERFARNPFDPTSRYTFMGGIVASLIPSVSKMGSVDGVVQSFGSILSTSVASIFPKTSALTEQQARDALDVCKDEDTLVGEYAADPFCNVIRGIPPQYLGKDPLLVVDELVGAGYLTANGAPTSTYTEFVQECIANDAPPGYDTATGFFDKSKVDLCKINNSNANIYLHYTDLGIEGFMSGEEEAAPVVSEESDKRALAAKIIAKNKVRYLPSAYPPRPTLEEVADGTVDPDSLDCGVNIHILRMIDAITDKHAITISSLNRGCVKHVPSGSSTYSRHYDGNGSALDISNIDGIATPGRDAGAQSVITIIMPTLSQLATDFGSFSQLGQSQCGATVTPVAAGVRPIRDTCNHLHFDIPPMSDPALQYRVNGAVRGGVTAV